MSDVKAPDAATDEQEVCVRCGLCCDGTWFSYGALRPGEHPLALAEGMNVARQGDEWIFQQPCTKFVGGSCSAYCGWRPAACHAYRCGLLERLADGETSLPEAKRIVSIAKEMAAAVRRDVPEFNGLFSDATSAKILARTKSSGDTNAGLAPAAELNAVSLNVLYRKYFARKAEKPSGDA